MSMKQRFWLFKRGNVYYVQDSETGKQQSLDVTDKLQAQRLRAAKEEAIGQKTLNLAVGRAYLAACDPSLVTRTWNMVMEKLCARAKKDTSRERNVREMARCPFDLIRRKKLIETTAEDFLRVLEVGKVSTNLYLRCLHNLALGLGWLPWPRLETTLQIARSAHSAAPVRGEESRTSFAARPTETNCVAMWTRCTITRTCSPTESCRRSGLAHE